MYKIKVIGPYPPNVDIEQAETVSHTAICLTGTIKDYEPIDEITFIRDFLGCSHSLAMCGSCGMQWYVGVKRGDIQCFLKQADVINHV